MFLRNTVFPGDVVNPIWNCRPSFGLGAACAHRESAVSERMRIIALNRFGNHHLVFSDLAVSSSGRVSGKENQRSSRERDIRFSNVAAGLSIWRLLLMRLDRTFLILWFLRFLMVSSLKTLSKKRFRLDVWLFGVERVVFPRSMFSRGALCPVYSSSSRMVFGEPSGFSWASDTY